MMGSSSLTFPTSEPETPRPFKRRRRWHPALSGSAYALAVAVLIGVPTGVLPTAWFIRITAVTWWAYPVWAGAALLIGIAAAQRARWRVRPRPVGHLVGGVGTAVAVGCPACNQVVMLAFGPAATGLWASMQPAVGLAALVGLLYAVVRQRCSGPITTRFAIGPSVRAQPPATVRGATCLALPTLVHSDAGVDLSPPPARFP